MRIRNVSANKLFIESLKFNSLVKQELQLVDLNHIVQPTDLQTAAFLGGQGTLATVGDGLFDETVCFH